MATILIDVMNANNNVIHTFPVSLEDKDPAANEVAYLAKALEAAASARLVSDAELQGLTAKIHVDRGGRMEPYGDNLSGDLETKAGLEQSVRERAYFLWEQAGCPEGKAQEFWDQALDNHLRERAYVLWQQEGSQEGNAMKDWSQIREFQEK